MKQITVKCIGFCGQSRTKTVIAETEKEARKEAASGPSTIKPYSQVKVLGSREIN